uniref:Uncharacterized protein n=1 Tax=Compsopogon caeruleus TaxID=31354 RepID=A0A7S1XEG1_9RHOD|mmetsp:Transcript_1808/g.3296  ORF Transcript_1808/g.3296 Transcript_1808/m.3296 type:complete len:177 (+) Transcript_1808:56-586(+)
MKGLVLVAVLVAVVVAVPQTVKVQGRSFTFARCKGLLTGQRLCGGNRPVGGRVEFALLGGTGFVFNGAGPGASMVGSTVFVCFKNGTRTATGGEFLLTSKTTSGPMPVQSRQFQLEAAQSSSTGAVKCVFSVKNIVSGLPSIGKGTGRKFWVFARGPDAWPSYHGFTNRGIKMLPF